MKKFFRIFCVRCGFLGIRVYYKNAKKFLDKHHLKFSDGNWPYNNHCGIINSSLSQSQIST